MYFNSLTCTKYIVLRKNDENYLLTLLAIVIDASSIAFYLKSDVRKMQSH